MMHSNADLIPFHHHYCLIYHHLPPLSVNEDQNTIQQLHIRLLEPISLFLVQLFQISWSLLFAIFYLRSWSHSTEVELPELGANMSRLLVREAFSQEVPWAHGRCWWCEGELQLLPIWAQGNWWITYWCWWYNTSSAAEGSGLVHETSSETRLNVERRS